MALTDIPLDLPGKLFRSPMPYGIFDPLETVYPAFREEGVDVVVVLNEESEVKRVTGRDLKDQYIRDGLEVLHFPILDFSIPEKEPLLEAVERTIGLLRSGKNVVVHCHAGIGRTGLFLAVLAGKVLGLSGDEAIFWLRRHLPEAVQTIEQVRFVKEAL